jgi:putative hydrolase of the HAD superfamily
MITTVLMDYDSTLHDMDGVMERSLDGVLGYTGEELYHTWVYDIHRALIHRRHLDRHDDTMFHCTLLFDRLELPFDKETADLICAKFEEAQESAKKNPIYYPDAVPALEALKDMGLTLCLSTGYGAIQKAKTMEHRTGKKFFEHAFSEQTLGVLKTEPEYYMKALKLAKAKPVETVSVGDTPLSDIRPAKLMGVKTIWVNRNQEPRPTERDQIADYETRDLRKAVEIIKRL